MGPDSSQGCMDATSISQGTKYVFPGVGMSVLSEATVIQGIHTPHRGLQSASFAPKLFRASQGWDDIILP